MNYTIPGESFENFRAATNCAIAQFEVSPGSILKVKNHWCVPVEETRRVELEPSVVSPSPLNTRQRPRFRDPSVRVKYPDSRVVQIVRFRVRAAEAEWGST